MERNVGKADRKERRFCRLLRWFVGPPEITGYWVRQLCLKLDGKPNEQEVAFEGREITGPLNLEGERIDLPIRFIRCDFTGPIVLTDAYAAKGIRLKDCKIHSLQGDRLEVDGDLVLERVHSQEKISLDGARVSGHLRCTGSEFSSSSRVAFKATGARIKGSIFFDKDLSSDKGFSSTGEVNLDGSTVTGRVTCEGGEFRNQGGIAVSANGLDCPNVRLGRGFTATGRVSLIGAIISRELNCSGGEFHNRENIAVQADGLICGGKVYLNEKFHAFGEVRFHNARITTEMNCTDGTFENDERTALGAGGLTCDGDIFLNDGFRAVGQVELIDARVGRQLNCSNGQFGKFHAERLVVDGKFVWKPRKTPDEVDVSFAEVGLLEDWRASWPSKNAEDKYGTCLAGFTFRNLEAELSCKDRITWLKNAEFAPGGYRQLTRVYREKGLGREAKDVAIAGQRDRRKRGRMPWPSKVWSGFLDYTVGYGYDIQRPLYVVLGWGLLGWLLFYLAQHNNLMVPVSGLSNTEPAAGTKAVTITATKCTAGYPCFVPPAYSFELFFPGVNLRQVMFWLPSAATWLGTLLLADVWLTILAGWALSAAVLAGIGHLFSQRD